MLAIARKISIHIEWRGKEKGLFNSSASTSREHFFFFTEKIDTQVKLRLTSVIW